jgi:hypothetical protein
MIGQLVGDALDIRVHVVVDRAHLECLLIDLVWGRLASASFAAGARRRRTAQAAADREESRLRTDDSLRVFGARRAQAELAELLLRLVGEGVEPRFGRLRRG